MYKVNENYLKIQGNYLFSTIAKKVQEFSEQNPDKEVIRFMGMRQIWGMSF